MSSLIWIQTVRHSDGIPERIFQKMDFEKIQQTTKKSMKNYTGGKQLMLAYYTNPKFLDILTLYLYPLIFQHAFCRLLFIFFSKSFFFSKNCLGIPS